MPVMLVVVGFWDMAERLLWRLFPLLVDHVDVLKPLQALEGRRRIHAHQSVICGALHIFGEQRVAFVVYLISEGRIMTLSDNLLIYLCSGLLHF